ncbi:MAG: SLBB domain-containing protein [Myxococcales bacterium]|nr:SLBB domain-containing protein [Myxococcales bacterium]
MGKQRKGSKSPKRAHRLHDTPRSKDADHLRLLPRFDELGGLRPGVSKTVSTDTGVPEATAYGVASFYHLLARPDVDVRVCTGLSCQMAGAADVEAALAGAGAAVEGCACLGQCDRAPAILRTDAGGGGHFTPLQAERPGTPGAPWGEVALPAVHLSPDSAELAINLSGAEDAGWSAHTHAQSIGPDATIAEISAAKLRGRGGAGFPAGIKWAAVRANRDRSPIVICNADEGEPGTFKDREVMAQRPHLLLEGMAIAARAIGAAEMVIYLRAEFAAPRKALLTAIAEARDAGHLDGLSVELALGHGAYICGEETALIEALEGHRGMPRHKPPFPTDSGYLGRPTLMNNVETFACVPAIVTRGADWFSGLGLGEATGTKLYPISGDVARPGVYELPLGTTMADLLAVAGGVMGGALKAFSPGGASSGLLPASMVNISLDFGPLQAAGSMLGSAGVVVLNDSRDIAQATLTRARFFRDESCGQCAPCRIGTQVIVRMLEQDHTDADTLERVCWEMEQGSICGLGQAAPIPIRHLVQHFPADFSGK